MEWTPMSDRRDVVSACKFVGWLCAVLALCGAVKAERIRLTIPSTTQWQGTDVQAVAGKPLTIWARGQYVARAARTGIDELTVTSRGTFHFSDAEIGNGFPLAAAGAGPAPCYCLIGRIGKRGAPFYVGDRHSVIAQTTGELYLGINDFDHRDNLGSVDVMIESNDIIRPFAQRQRVAFDGPSGSPKVGCRVVVFYVDGLRPDIVQEMAAMGHLPNIRRIFLDGGTHVENSYTVFPSDTITSNGSLWTGMFSDRHGIKSQVGFNRRLQRSENYLGKFGPVLNDLLLNPRGLDRLALNTGTAITRLAKGEQAAQQYHDRRTSETPTLQSRLVDHQMTFAAGVMPLMSQLSPDLWTRYLADEVPYFGTHLADRYVDEANTTYAIERLFEDLKDVTIVWLPENDTVSHHEFRGAFGMARRTLVEADQAIGQMVDRLKRKKLLSSTYLMVVSDHGHIGGRTRHLERCDIVNEFFHQTANVNKTQDRVGGGLGLSVRQDRYSNPTQGDKPEDFVFIDAVADGVARVSLPRGGYGLQDWSGPNDIQTLFRYPIRGLNRPVNLFEELSRFSVVNSQGDKESPVDLVLAKIDSKSVLVTAAQRGFAVMERRREADGSYRYRYSVAENVRPLGQLSISWDVVREPKVDPLRLAGRMDCCLFNTWHDEETWLRITMGSLYPDSVVAMTRHLLWKPELQAREKEYGVDLVVTAKAGWVFHTANEPGSAHGHPFHETMNNSLFIAGPNIRQGAVVGQPVRSVDVTPTLLDMVGIDTSEMGLDGKPIRSIYQSRAKEIHVFPAPQYWQNVDLDGWLSISWEPRPVYPVQPRSVNQPMNFWDLSNLTYNTASVREVSVNRILDDTSRFVTTRVLQQRARKDKPLQELYREGRQTLNESEIGAPQFRLNKVALGDYSWTSEGNLDRASGVVSWAWEKAHKFDEAVSSPFGKKSYLGTDIAEKALEDAGYSAREVRRVGSRVAAQLVDRWALSGLEDTADQLINNRNAQPATRQIK